LIFASCEDPKEIWPVVVEKAYAKLYGSYEDLSGGRIVEALCALTGGHGAVVDVKTQDPDAVWSLLLGHDFGASGARFIGAGSLAHLEDHVAQGIVPGHAYTVLDAREFASENGPVRIVKLRNPWNRGEWRGPWCDGSRLWRSELGVRIAKDVKYEAKEDGEFWMSLQDLLQRFQTLDFCDGVTEGRDERVALLRKELQQTIGDAHQEIKDGVEDNRSIDDLLADIEGVTPKKNKKNANRIRKDAHSKDVKAKKGKNK